MAMLNLAACGPSDSDFATFGEFESPDNASRIVVDVAPSSGFAYAPLIVRFHLVAANTDELLLLGTTRLANDGARISDRNISADWLDPATVRFCLSGAEQDDEVVSIDVTKVTFTTEQTNCAG